MKKNLTTKTQLVFEIELRTKNLILAYCILIFWMQETSFDRNTERD